MITLLRLLKIFLNHTFLILEMCFIIENDENRADEIFFVDLTSAGQCPMQNAYLIRFVLPVNGEKKATVHILLLSLGKSLSRCF